MNIKHFKTRVIGIVLAVSLLFGGTNVLAFPAADYSTVITENPIFLNQKVHVDLSADDHGEWWIFVPQQTGFYEITPINPTGRPDICAYDLSGDPLTCNYCFDDWGGRTYHMDAGVTYYIWVSKYYDDQPCSYDFRVERGVGQYYAVNGQKYYIQRYEYPLGSNYEIVMGLDVPDDGVYTFQWYGKGSDGDYELIPGATDSTYTCSPEYSGYRVIYTKGGLGTARYLSIRGTYDQHIIVDDENSSHDYHNNIRRLEYGSNSEITLYVELQNPAGATFQWQRYSYFSNQYIDIPGATSSSYTVNDVGNEYQVIVSDNLMSVPVYYRIDWFDYCSISGVVHSLGNSGEETSAYIPTVTGNNNEVRFLAAPSYYSWLHNNETHCDYRWSSGNTVPVFGFNSTTVDYVTVVEEFYYPFNYSYHLTTDLFAFVRNGYNSAEISVNEPQQVVLNPVIRAENDYPGNDYGYSYVHPVVTSECMVYSFTPEESGTYTITSSALDIGDPYVALFDQDYRFIACSDNMDGSFFWERPAPGNDIDHNFSLAQHLTGGTTYYFVVWSQDRNTYDEITPDLVLADYTVTLTSDSIDNNNVNDTTSESGTESLSSTGGSTGTEVTPTTPAPSTPTPAIPPANNAQVTETGVAGFVERLYTIALGRASDPVGKQDWIDAITLRGETGASCARGFLYSPEFLNKGVSNEEFVAVLYRTFFNREPDQDGFNAWVGVLNNGGSKEEVIEGFINSTEWANLCLFYGIRNGGTGVPSIEIEPNQGTIDFATRLYTTCLGRNADQAGLMAWARQLANQRDTGTGAAHGFFFSAEFANQNVDNREFVTRLYRTFMNREPDQAGFDAWVAQLDAGVSREEVFNGFAQSIEFARICALYGIVR